MYPVDIELRNNRKKASAYFLNIFLSGKYKQFSKTIFNKRDYICSFASFSRNICYRVTMKFLPPLLAYSCM